MNVCKNGVPLKAVLTGKPKLRNEHGNPVRNFKKNKFDTLKYLYYNMFYKEIIEHDNIA